MRNNLIYGSLILISTIVGLGIFTLPYIAKESGIFFYFWLIFIPFLIFILHLIYGEIIFQVEEKHNLPTLVAKIINPKFKTPVWFFDFVGLTMVFIVYLIAINQILKEVFIINLNFKLLCSIIISFLIIFRNNIFAKVDSILSFLLIFFFLFLFFYSFPKINISNLLPQENNFWLSYGVILFSFAGYQSLQIIYDLIGKNKKSFLKVNLISLIIVFLIYLLYVISTLGLAGENIPPFSIIFLLNYLENLYLDYFILVLFLLSILTTFVSLAYYLKRGLIADFNLNEKLSWLIISLLIVLLSFYNLDNLIKIISLIGSLFIGINLILIMVCYLKLKNLYYFKFSKIIIYLLIVIFGLGWLFNLLVE